MSLERIEGHLIPVLRALMEREREMPHSKGGWDTDYLRETKKRQKCPFLRDPSG